MLGSIYRHPNRANPNRRQTSTSVPSNRHCLEHSKISLFSLISSKKTEFFITLAVSSCSDLSCVSCSTDECAHFVLTRYLPHCCKKERQARITETESLVTGRLQEIHCAECAPNNGRATHSCHSSKRGLKSQNCLKCNTTHTVMVRGPMNKTLGCGTGPF
jgi:hypothetical protein